MVGHQVLVNHRTSNSNKHSNGADDDYQEDHGMRLGINYQADIPQFIAFAPAPPFYETEKAIQVWSPNNNIPEHVLCEYIEKAKEKFFYTSEQALGMLSWHKFDLNRAYADLPNFVPYPNEWSVEDKVLFEQAYQFHQKQFYKIKQMLPDKTMANLINYYYSWKKTRTRASLMERQTRRLAARKAADSNANSDDDDIEDEDDDDDNNEQPKGSPKQGETTNEEKCDADQSEGDSQNSLCCGCRKALRVDGKTTAIIIDGHFDFFCVKCYIEWKAGGMRIVTELEQGDCFYHPDGCAKSKLFTYNDVLTLVEGPPEAGDAMIKHLDSQIEDVKRDIQAAKQTISQIDEKIQPIDIQISKLNTDQFKDILPEYNPTKIWTQDETTLVVQGLRRYGTDFSAISDVVRTKTADSIRAFYVNQKERFGLDLLVNEHENATSLHPSHTRSTENSSNLRVLSNNSIKK